MVTKSQQQAYDNLKSKYEKLQYKLDVAEQEKDEMKREKENEIKELKKQLNDTLKENNKVNETAVKNYDKLYGEISKINSEVVALVNKKKEDSKTISKLLKTIEVLKNTIINFKSKNIKNSSNSGKPSSTNGYVKVIQNNREQSNKKKGGQKGRIGKRLDPVENPIEIIDVLGQTQCDCGGEIEYSELEYIKKQVVDMLNEVRTLEYRYHKGICKKCGKIKYAQIPQEHNSDIQYSKKLQSMVLAIKHVSNTSNYTVQEMFQILTRGKVKFSVGWIHKNDRILAKRCEPMINNITQILEKSELAYADETTVKINNKLGCCITFATLDTVLYDMFENKSKESFDEFGIFNKYMGILMHDHNKTYYMYLAITHAECNVHILRYVKGVIDLFQRKSAIKFREYLMQIYKEKLEKISNGGVEFSKERIEEIESEYISILGEWKNEYDEVTKKYKNIPKAYTDEENLFERLLQYKEEHLLFIKDFRVAFSNNEAERNLRSIKIKMNTSKLFGDVINAKVYAKIKSIVETAKKRKMDILEIIEKALKNDCADIFRLENTPE